MRELETVADETLFGRPLPLAPAAQPKARRATAGACRVCGAVVSRPAGEPQLCVLCVAHAPDVLAHVDAQLARAAQDEDAAHRAWEATRDAVAPDVRRRWDALTMARADAFLALRDVERGPRPAGEPERARQRLQAEAREAYTDVLNKIERTRAASPEIAALLSAELAFERALEAAQDARQRWEMARSDLEALSDGVQL